MRFRRPPGRRMPIGILLAALLPLFACQPDTSEAPEAPSTIRPDEGVDLVANSGPDVALDWTFTPVTSIPADPDGDIRFAGLDSWEVGADAAGRVYVLDVLQRFVRVFDETGGQVGTVVYSSGETNILTKPVALAVAPDGGMSVFDRDLNRVVHWGPKGEWPVGDEPATTFWGPDLGLSEWATLYATISADDGTERTIQLTAVSDTSTGALTEQRQTVITVDFPSCELEALRLVPILEPYLRWSVHGGTAVAATRAGYEIDMFERGELTRLVSRDVPPRPVTTELAQAQVAEGISVSSPRPCTVPAAKLVEKRGYADVVPAILELAVAPDGEVWVRRGYARGDPNPIDILAPDGTYLGTLPDGTPFPAAFVGDAADYRLVAIESTGDAGADRLVVHAIGR